VNVKTILTGALLLLAVGGAVYVLVGGQGARSGDTMVPAQRAAEALPANGVVVYYFHGTKRCMTCNKMEALAAETLYDSFGDRLRDGSVVFRAVNIETDETRHFVEDFEMTNRCVVMVERRGGEDLTWRRLDAIWEKISDDQAYSDYIAENLAACLDDLGRKES
jgi:hypothetical protein